MKVLITGNHGFVGTNLIEVLSANHEIIRWDIRSDEEFPDYDAVIHLAGKAHDTKNVTREEEYFKVNTELTKKIYDTFLKSSGKKFIFFSSIKAQDNDTPYARSKRAAEDYILNHKSEISQQARDVKRVYILRPCMIHGKGVKGNLPLLLKYVKKGWPWPLAAFENQRSYASMENVSYIVSMLLSTDVPSGLYNVCDDEPVSTNELIEMICQYMGQRTRIWRIPKGILKALARLGDVLQLPLNSERLGKLTGDNIIDNSKIKYALDIANLPISSKEGLGKTIQYMINEK